MRRAGFTFLVLIATLAARPASAQQQRLDGLAAGDDFGNSLACCDINRDRFAEVIVGAPGADPNGLDFAGSVFVFFGGPVMAAALR